MEWPAYNEWLLMVLATWRMTHLIVHEDGPFACIARLRLWMGNSSWGRLMDCPYCLSLWLATVVMLSPGLHGWRAVVLWWAVAGGVGVLERLTGTKS